MSVFARKEHYDCYGCIHLIPHSIYEYIAFCSLREEMIVGRGERCEEYAELSWKRIEQILNEKGCVYCLTCRRPIYSMEELEEHRKDVIALDFCVDDVTWEDAPAAD